jgi:hypothetical protein
MTGQRLLFQQRLAETSAAMLDEEEELRRAVLPQAALDLWRSARVSWLHDNIQLVMNDWPDDKPCPEQDAIEKMVRGWFASFRGEAPR